MTHSKVELKAHIWWFCSTHEYFETTKYELSTPTMSESTRPWYILHVEIDYMYLISLHQVSESGSREYHDPVSPLIVGGER